MPTSLVGRTSKPSTPKGCAPCSPCPVQWDSSGCAIYPMQRAVWLRVIEYQITDERLGEPGRVYRLGTTWLNPRTAPAKELLVLYHERWEIEIVVDEIKTHLRVQQKVLRSHTPEGVRQELYAL